LDNVESWLDQWGKRLVSCKLIGQGEITTQYCTGYRHAKGKINKYFTDLPSSPELLLSEELRRNAYTILCTYH
jgi:hypothetical protein